MAEYGLWVLLNLDCCERRREKARKKGNNESVCSVSGKGEGGKQLREETHLPPLLDLPDLVVKQRLLGRVREDCHCCEFV